MDFSLHLCRIKKIKSKMTMIKLVSTVRQTFSDSVVIFVSYS